MIDKSFKRISEPGPRTLRFRLDTDEWEPEFRKGGDLLVDPDRPKTDGCLILARVKGYAPFLSRWYSTGRNHRGHRVKSGDPQECFRVDTMGFRYNAADEKKADWFEVLGVVGGWLMAIDAREPEPGL